ncbi:hypothetical protein [Clostridium tetanomorphum]|uniref:NERD domain-containing protein n=1 Tax=Clostridium tetanomorphum TaxID=1553 RepID=A0A923E940_CLOTT|nr:hypothetical protein [Clostridium tetanomorphum]MBC2398743.1 hypothetical protein [Clostridium tetanomorphum]NRZ99295.1 hypothetical protein [Clostridium tetanomorphum]
MGLMNVELEEFLKKHNTEDILSGILEMQMSSYGQLIDERIPAAEYLASNAIRYYISDSKKNFTWNDFLQLEEFAKNIYNEDISKLFEEALALVEATDEKKNEFLKSEHMKLKSMAFRGDGYIYQLLSMSEMLYRPFDEELKKNLGFTFTCCEQLFVYIFKLYVKKALEAHSKKYKFTKMIETLYQLLRGKAVLMLPSIKEGYIFRVYKEDLYNKFNKFEVDSIIKYLSVCPGESRLKPTEVSEFKVLTSKPLVDFGDYIYLPLLESTLMNFPKLFHYTFVAEKKFNKHIVGRYTKNRGDVVEDLTVKYLQRLIDKRYIYSSLEYKNEDGEADVTIQYENTTIFCECKSKILTLNTLKGITESIQTDIYKAIGIAYEQAVRSIKYIAQGKCFHKTINGKEKEIKLDNTEKKYIVCVTAENFGVIPSKIYEYVEFDKTIPIVPYVVNIYDLDIITQECVDFIEFIKYMEFRKENSDIISSVDELDIFGYFKANGGQMINIDADELVITDYTREFDKKYKKKNHEFFNQFD